MLLVPLLRRVARILIGGG